MQAGGAAKAGAPIKARVLDISKKDGVVDLSLKPALTAAGTKKAAKALASMEASPALHSCASEDCENPHQGVCTPVHLLAAKPARHAIVV